MKIIMKTLSIEDEGNEIIHIDNFSMTLKPNFMKGFDNGLKDVFKATIINSSQKETKED